ncbi:undecaprenyldiphospho-muramoylpentapeptide beta-N-acetylglucosaminyltransferase [Coprobacter fastidiosus]|uniref:UDP-N-acetylglucosamine--N-acetylmuramyl-(pentapeptide) pyrophosphoryl-undecaprenol N-acetylglucosamine transferase n=1 Tax=Coprobacter fastidiosus NSB1 = JCM 33896 TaxID=1349822 RepID=A0A495WC46_9BACT|nr:undecaprenyldiphospho-muramoylpentapeptide beta-N-acetylglucosaminyltransferase [Coprobacter fastidiosus]RKT58343.1 UDP-N-acetylglucosamine-N-acetylmuramylpentapeptide N-acetylglucosamine transferase [Coprobacter fastidiosus NSB1 = JCM 33896]
MDKKIKVLVSGGGTGGHIFPAISIANAIKNKCPNADILFVGAENRMEMEKVPAAGYPIIGLPVSGFDRKHLLKNIKVLFRLFKSIRLADKTVKSFSPDIAVGVGGYASGPTLWAAARRGIPTLIQEQNSYAGVTNKLLASKAKAICVAYENMERFFPKDRIILTGNPVRQELQNDTINREEAIRFFNLDPSKKTILVIGGSLGARTINNSIAAGIEKIPQNIQLIWQSGKGYDTQAKKALEEKKPENIKQMPFISRMDMAYKAADLVISRAGASSISELCLLGKPVILIPSPNVAEDHQTKNAQALSTKNAALMIRDCDAQNLLIDTALKTVQDETSLKNMSDNISKMAQRDSATRIADIIFELVTKNKKNGKL